MAETLSHAIIRIFSAVCGTQHVLEHDSNRHRRIHTWWTAHLGLCDRSREGDHTGPGSCDRPHEGGHTYRRQ